MVNTSKQQALWIASAALVYFGAHYVGFLFPDTQNILAVIWVAGGIGLASLLLSPRRLWPILLVAFFIAGNTANLLIGRPLFNSVGFMTANIVESFTCAWFICRYRDKNVHFDCINDIAALIFAATVLNSFSSLLGAGTAAVSGSAPFLNFLRAWWVADGLGILLITPLIITWKSFTQIKLLPAFELGCFLIIWCLAAYLAFHGGISQILSPFSPYIPVVLITWAALRFGQRIVTLALLILGVIAVTSKAVTVGPLVFGGVTLVDRLLLVQIYLALTSVTGMLLAASHAEAKAAKKLAQEQHASLSAIGDNLPDGMIYQVVREHDGRMRFLYLSAGLEKLRGVSFADVSNQPLLLYEQVVEEDRPKVIAAEKASAESMTVCNVIIRIRRPDGHIRWLQLSSMPRRLADGRIIWDGIETDITDKRIAELALHESEEKHRLFFENANDVIFIHDSQAKILEANPMACQLLGYSRAELLSMTVDQIDSPEEALKIPDRMSRLLEQGHLIFETHHRHKSGLLIPIEVSTKLITWEGKPAVLSICRDITERRRTEKELRASEEKFRTVASYIHNWEYWIAEDGRLVYIAPSCERITGYTADAFYQDPGLLIRIIHPESRGNFMRHRDDVTGGMTKGDCQAMDFRILTRNGEERWISHVCRNTFDQEGKFIGRRVSNVDITERKQAEAKLIEYSQRLQLATASGKFAVWDWNVKDNIMFWDDRMFELYGITRNAFPNTVDAWINGLHPDDKQRAIDESNAACLGEKDFNTVFRVLRPDGTVKHLKANAMTIRDESGKAIRMIGINTDITEQIRAEEERQSLEAHLQQAQKMEAIGTLAGGIAHDFNNILGAILGYAEMAYEDSLSGSVQPSDLSQVVEASHRAKNLVKQILAFSRQAVTQKIPLRPAALVKESIKLLRSSIPATIHIQQDIDPETGLILADPTQIHQIIMNLCTNAYHAMEETGGTLSLSLNNKVLVQKDLVDAPDVQPGHFVQLSIRDTGSGITPEIQERIFDPYFTTKEAGKGTGMGLAIVHGIVKSYGGFITCRSEVGAGTVFEICIPVFLEQIVPETKELESIPVGTERILFVDDEEMLAKMGRIMLERLGYTVTVQTSSTEALATFKAQPEAFDLVITDQTMPEMTGFDLARSMLQIRPGMPIILCTGYSNQVSEDQVRSCGIKGFAMKPLARKNVAVLIRKILDKGKSFS